MLARNGLIFNVSLNLNFLLSTQPEEEFDLYRARKSAVNKVVPPFVQVDSLHAGQTYVSMTHFSLQHS